MSNDWYQDMVDFHKEVMLDNFPTQPHLVTSQYRNLRQTLISEEVGELLDALSERNLAEIADGIADSLVVILGTAVTYGIDIRPVWDAVHKANMLKATGPLREDGKRLKPEGWTHPDILELLVPQGLED